MSLPVQSLREPHTAEYTDADSSRPPATRRLRVVALWLVQVVAALGFMTAAAAKFTGADQIEAVFAAMGAGHWLMYTIGALEVAGAVGLLLPRLAGPAATAFVALMAGALLTHAVVGGFAGPAVAMFVLAAVVAWVRRRDTAAVVYRVLRRGHG